MSDCAQYEKTIEDYVAGRLEESGLGPLLIHCHACAECRRLLELHRDLVTLGSRIEEPGEAEFEALHARVLGEIVRQGAQSVERAGWWPPAMATWLRAAAVVATAAVLFIAGLAAGSFLLARPDGAAPRLLTAISADAASNRSLTDVEDSRFTYSNVSFRRLDGDRVALDFDVTTHVQLTEPVRSELVREVLVHALLNPTNTGARLKAMSYASGSIEPKVRQALIFAMRRDENVAVRLKALTVLSDHLGNPEVEDSVLAILRDDDSVQMRLLALDLLAAHSIDRDRIREAIQTNQRPGDEALMVRLAEYEG